jgi:hypothetical protein
LHIGETDEESLATYLRAPTVRQHATRDPDKPRKNFVVLGRRVGEATPEDEKGLGDNIVRIVSYRDSAKCIR